MTWPQAFWLLPGVVAFGLLVVVIFELKRRAAARLKAEESAKARAALKAAKAEEEARNAEFFRGLESSARLNRPLNFARSSAPESSPSGARLAGK